MDRQRFESARTQAINALLAARANSGHWEGELSSSALSTATAVTALAVLERESIVQGPTPKVRVPHSAVEAGLRWLAQNINPDGGWGDTVLSFSNISTTTLCWAAFGVVPEAEAKFRPIVEKAEQWLLHHAGGTQPERLVPAIVQRYGKDRTFSVPILTSCALAGRLGAGREAWRWVKSLPFELAACPHQWFAALRLPVVSYALPALIAIGQARHFHRPTRNPLVRLLRNATRERTLRILTEIQPASGGFLEATPLTSFVTMSLAGSGRAGHEVTRNGLEFLLASQRPDGSWPIDTNLATWLTTLAVEALSASSDKNGKQETENRRAPSADVGPWTLKFGLLARWLLAQQHCEKHPYTHAAPGGWAWTDLSGGVPDADDTAGALLALRVCCGDEQTKRADATVHLREAAFAGVNWLLDLQNRDGGIPTFCRGWGALPFDRSSADITAHALRAWIAWRNDSTAEMQDRVDLAIRRGLAFLVAAQRSDGSWSPLWFGNQHAPDEANLTYGTARVLRALAETEETLGLRDKGARWLLAAQHPDGSWGGADGTPPSVEETALATQALAALLVSQRLGGVPVAELRDSVERGTRWLVERVESGDWMRPSPIGFYFAKLWYFERLYPLIFTVGALQAAQGPFAVRTALSTKPVTG